MQQGSVEIQIDYCGGRCPVQSEGQVGGKRFYFRSRHNAWHFIVAATSEDAYDLDEGKAEYYARGADTYGGYMPPELARQLVQKQCEFYLLLLQINASE